MKDKAKIKSLLEQALALCGEDGEEMESPKASAPEDDGDSSDSLSGLKLKLSKYGK
jgi:hypothetical protein